MHGPLPPKPMDLPSSSTPGTLQQEELAKHARHAMSAKEKRRQQAELIAGGPGIDSALRGDREGHFRVLGNEPRENHGFFLVFFVPGSLQD